MADTYENLVAWARTKGYDPNDDYIVEQWLPTDDHLSPNFRLAEFQCNHCGALPSTGIKGELIDILEDVRRHFGNKAVNINSGYRCATHNRNVGGAKNSQHLFGSAADIWIRGVDPHDVYKYLDPNHEGGLGHYNSFTHIDVRDNRARWSG